MRKVLTVLGLLLVACGTEGDPVECEPDDRVSAPSKPKPDATVEVEEMDTMEPSSTPAPDTLPPAPNDVKPVEPEVAPPVEVVEPPPIIPYSQMPSENCMNGISIPLPDGHCVKIVGSWQNTYERTGVCEASGTRQFAKCTVVRNVDICARGRDSRCVDGFMRLTMIPLNAVTVTGEDMGSGGCSLECP